MPQIMLTTQSGISWRLGVFIEQGWILSPTGAREYATGALRQFHRSSLIHRPLTTAGPCFVAQLSGWPSPMVGAWSLQPLP